MANDPGTIERIRAEVENNNVVLFMNGTPVFPQCSPSAQAVQILSMLGVKYRCIDVLADPGLRPVLVSVSNWPNMPQLYVRGAFIGGADIMREMFQSGELQELIRAKKPTRVE
ncbi:MAG: Grx4 family monothiol glutaredoxin [Alphaproteobacteria bacterium]|nr:Grx4 family monothiol glutaredoxin [Alphaproteobacteria bacterium]